MNNISIIDKREPFQSLITKFRDKAYTGEDLKTIYRSLGSIFAFNLSSYFNYEEHKIVTPMNKPYTGTRCENDTILFVSTFEDNEDFCKTIGDYYGIEKYAKLNVDRAENGWNASVVSIELPNKTESIETIVFCKSVLATGCTAKAILKKMCDVCNPENIIVISIISSDEAINELKNEYKYLNISFLIGEIDILECTSGLLLPGVGMLESRLKTVDNL